MTEQIWKTWTPKYDGHAPDDEGAMDVHCFNGFKWSDVGENPRWIPDIEYRYRAKQPDLLAKCLALPQADRDALIAELQNPVRDWAVDVWVAAIDAAANAEPDPTKDTGKRYDSDLGVAVIRSMCQPKMQSVAYYDEGQFHWMIGIAPRDCELFAEWKRS